MELYSGIWGNARREEVILEIRRYWKAKIKKDPEVLRDYLHDDEFKAYLEWRAGSNRQSIGHSYALITVNPKEMKVKEIPEFMKKVEKAVKKIWISEWMYCYEWRANTKGLHAHIRCKVRADKGKSAIVREIHSTFAKWCDNYYAIDVKFSKDSKAFMEYVCGLRNGKPKDNAKYDMVNRAKCNMKDVYVDPQLEIEEEGEGEWENGLFEEEEV